MEIQIENVIIHNHISETETKEFDNYLEDCIDSNDIGTNIETINEPSVKQVKSDIIINGVYDSIDDITGCLKNLQLELKQVHKKFNLLKKDYSKVVAIKNKLENKRKLSKEKQQSGFTKPRLISNEMCDFLKLERNTSMGRNTITSLINSYIVLHNLRDENDRRIILPDQPLRKILDIEEDHEEIITYFNLQRYLKRHFIK